MTLSLGLPSSNIERADSLREEGHVHKETSWTIPLSFRALARPNFSSSLLTLQSESVMLIRPTRGPPEMCDRGQDQNLQLTQTFASC